MPPRSKPSVADTERQGLNNEETRAAALRGNIKPVNSDPIRHNIDALGEVIEGTDMSLLQFEQRVVRQTVAAEALRSIDNEDESIVH